ncbi:MAG: YeeE/YedE thiosulfate transporter family protein [Gemmatimonadota bacterium]
MTTAAITEVNRPTVKTVVRQRRTAAPYMNPYLAGVGVGLVLLTAFVTMGHGVGASGAVVSIVGAGVQAVAPAHAAGSEFFQPYLGATPVRTLDTWLVLELAGIFLGGFASAWLAGRVKPGITGRRIGASPRLLNAVAGGTIMGFATRLARGCTSGQGLTGGALLNVGSWAFMLALFAGAYLVAHLVRRQWT